MLLKPSGIPQDKNTFGVLGYLIVINKQIHSYQIDLLNGYLKCLDLKIEDTVIANIIDGKEDAISLITALSSFKHETSEVQKDLYHMLVSLASVDNRIDDDEKVLINQIMSDSKVDLTIMEEIKANAIKEADGFRKSNNILFEKPLDNNVGKNFFIRFWKWIVKFFSFIFGREKSVLKNEIDDEDFDYKSIIEKCASIAAEDFKIVQPSYTSVINSATECIQKIKEYKKTLSLEKGLSSEVAKVISIFVDALNENVLTQSKQAADSLVQKERTISDFTISLIGRTKAGKSTLHSILTKQGADKIGSGKQRTTRYNRVYQWNLLRLIDTPGIGSAEADGRTDEEIAKSVLGESDIICFVIADDSILKDILEFIEKIAELNKPIIILLNHKENITNESRFKRYIANPNDWLTNEGESNLKGHINRIKRYADDNGFGHLLKIYPVFLLAAQMAGDEKYKNYRNVLWNSSNMDLFVDQLKAWIRSAGSIKRSQTILDETSLIFESFMQRVKKEQKPLLAQIDSLTTQRKSKIETLEKVKEQTISSIRATLEDRFNYLAVNEALIFAEKYYNKKGNIGDYWKDFIEEIKFADEIQSDIASELNTFSTKIDETVKDLFEDFYYSAVKSFEFEGLNIPF